MKNYKSLFITAATLATLLIGYHQPIHPVSANQIVRTTHIWNNSWHNNTITYTVNTPDDTEQQNQPSSTDSSTASNNQGVQPKVQVPVKPKHIKHMHMAKHSTPKKAAKKSHHAHVKHNIPVHIHKHVHKHVYKHYNRQYSQRPAYLWITTGSLIGPLILGAYAYYKFRRYQKNNYYLNITNLTKTGRDSLIKTNLLNHRL